MSMLIFKESDGSGLCLLIDLNLFYDALILKKCHQFVLGIKILWNVLHIYNVFFLPILITTFEW